MNKKKIRQKSYTVIGCLKYLKTELIFMKKGGGGGAEVGLQRMEKRGNK